jgi:tRNA A-37 threonylcarbamoyl transferase component Bud32
MNIDIKGHSGCNIDIIEDDDNLFVKKSTVDSKYLKRLELQGKKQQNDECLTDYISSPYVYEVKKTDDECYILMTYIYANNFIDYFEKASPQDINHFIESFIKYIHNEIDKCKIEKVSKNVFIDKFNSVVKNCEKNELLKGNMRVKSILKDCENVFANLPEEIELPVGICHGDLTFSNILFASNKFYFIDYLDSFIETPIQDIVKLRQDTKYFWSTMMYKKKYDVVRLNIIFNYIDKKISEHFGEFEYYYRNYDRLQLMNILRILPYVKEEKVRDFVLNILTGLPKY